MCCSEGLTALHLACAQDIEDERCVEYLLDHKVLVPVPIGKLRTCLKWSPTNGFYDESSSVCGVGQ